MHGTQILLFHGHLVIGHLLFVQVPPIDTWNGKPRNFLVHYGEHKEVVNTSLDDLRRALSNSSATPKTVLKNLDPHSNYTVRVAMSTEGGYGEFSKPCFIQAIPEEDSNTKGWHLLLLIFLRARS